MKYFLFILSFLFCFKAVALDSYADLVERVMPSVVNISTQKTVVNEDDLETDNLMLVPDLSGRESLGSGFFIRSDGHILTNYHVIKDAKTITVVCNNGKNFDAKVVGIDKPSDLAILKINGNKEDKFSPVIFGNADDMRVGDIVLTFGNPYGLGISVSQGIISAKSRHIGLGEQQYMQTDAAINQGNSGGPMFNPDGEVVGINTAIFTATGANGIGFALPSNIANWISSQLLDNGKVRRGWTGLTVSNGIDRYTDKAGFVITEINEEANAYKEGLRVGDIIVSYNDRPAIDIDAFQLFTETLEPGQALRLTIISMGEEIRNVIRIQEMPEAELSHVTNKALSDSAKFYHQNIDKDVFYVSELNIAVKEATPRGLMIVRLERKSPLYATGVKEGDIILEADRADIYSVDNLLESIRNAIVDDFRPISFFIQGIDNSFYVSAKVEQEND